jgi:hypothetical protein
VLCFALVLLYGCNQNDYKNDEAKDSPINKTGVKDQEDTNTTKTQLHFNMDIENEKVDVVADYLRADINSSVFLLNRDFTVTEILADGVPIDIKEATKTILLLDSYEIKQYDLPVFENNIRIIYNGSLNGSSGLTSYATEQITPEFSFLRWETFCHPLFAKIETFEDLVAAITTPYNLSIIVSLPVDYTAIFTHSNVQDHSTENGITFSADGELAYGEIAIAVAQYTTIETESGIFSFLRTTNANDALSLANEVISHTHEYMNKHFGERVLENKLRVVEIPVDLGSFAITHKHITFVESNIFNSVTNMTGLVHEFIHIGWNAKTEDFFVQRSRFFDEAFTSYFEYRVMIDILGNDVAPELLKRFENTYGIDLVPIRDFGRYEYGDLSYTIGALFLHELSELVGIDNFDSVTTTFLEKYQYTAVDFDLFNKYYTEMLMHPDVEEFLFKWIG